MKEHRVSIWFIIGSQLIAIGVIVLGADLYTVFAPPINPVMFQDLHPGLYEGVVLLALGALYTVKFRPKRKAVVRES